MPPPPPGGVNPSDLSLLTRGACVSRLSFSRVSIVPVHVVCGVRRVRLFLSNTACNTMQSAKSRESSTLQATSSMRDREPLRDNIQVF